MKTLIGLIIIFLAMSSSNVNSGSVHAFKMKSIDGKEVSLNSFKGKKMLIVNVASECGFTRQYKDLETLSKTYKDKLVVLGFPSNDFGGQEPGTNEEIQGFCKKNYGVSFPMFSKISVVGKLQDPLFKFLSSKDLNGVVNDAPKWNFCKYLIDEKGMVIKFFPSSVNPTSKDIVELL